LSVLQFSFVSGFFDVCIAGIDSEEVEKGLVNGDWELTDLRRVFPDLRKSS
jgi:hypothetical protein